MTPALRRRVLFASLYFSEGAPIGFLWWALKFLGAPAIDILRSPRWPLRAWIASCQTVMGLCLLATLLFDWRADFAAIAALLLLHAVFAASQDVAVDAWALQPVRPEHRGALNAWMQGGILAGRALFGGGVLLLDQHIGPSSTILLLVAAIWSSLAVLAVFGEAEVFALAGTSLASRRREFLSALDDALRRRSSWLIVAFAAMGGAGIESVGLVVGPSLLDRGFTQGQIGEFLFLPTVLAMMTGAAAAGLFADRIDRRAAVAWTLVATAITIVLLGSGAATAGWLVLALLAVLYFLIAAMSATNPCESWSAFAVGRLTTMLGFGPAFAWMAALSPLALPCLWWLPTPDRSPRSV